MADLPEVGVTEAVGELEAVSEETIDGDVERPRQGDERRPACVAGPCESQQRGRPEVAVVACQRVGTGWGWCLPGPWDRLGCQLWDHPARLAEAGGGSSLTRRVTSFGTEVSGYGIQGGQRG